MAIENTDFLVSWANFWTLSLILVVSFAVFFTYGVYKRRFNHLNQQYQQLLSFLHHSNELVAVLDHKLEPNFINSHLLALTNQATTDANSLSLISYTTENSMQLMNTLLENSLSERAYWQGELWLASNNTEKRRCISASITQLGNSPPLKYLFVGQDISSQKRQQQLLLQQRIRDPETNVLASAVFNEFLDKAIQSCTPQKPKLILLIIKVNLEKDDLDSKAQTAISEQLVSLAKYMQHQLPKGAVLGRHSTDSLSLLLPAYLCTANINSFASHLALTILNHNSSVERLSNNLETAIGIAVYPDDADTTDAILTTASAALLNSSSKDPKQRIQFANSLTQQDYLESLNQEATLALAIENQQIEVYFQPQISISSNKVVGYEALLRWLCPMRGTISAQNFIQLAYDTRLILSLDHAVIDKCCQQFLQWHKQGLERGRISINIAKISFEQDDFVTRLKQQLQQHHLAGEHFALELSEEVFLSPCVNLSAKLQQLIELGLQITLDKVGEGVLSIDVLRRYPLHNIKLTKSYIADIEHNEQQRNITASLIRIASYLQLNIIAVGIENEMQAYLLHVMGCDILQGFLFSKALPAKDIAGLLTKENKLLHKHGH
ncbi:EAL domain-containing protein [Rheinheimera sp. WS51]|uniref:EAL domain-containing protein n=1 Tax=Rheinheimera sp. WS51 TaxID=3425886 RepID=UPI003D8D6A79